MPTPCHSNTALKVQPRSAEVSVGQQLVLTCSDLDMHLDFEIYWHKRSLAIHRIQSSRSDQLVINVTSINQTGLYFCCVLIPGQGKVCSPDAKVQVKGRS